MVSRIGDFSPYRKVKHILTALDSFIVGSILGDASLPSEKGRGHALSFQHSIKQESYALYKRDLAESLGLHTRTYYYDYGYPFVLVFCTLDKDVFLHYRHAFYPNGKKTVTRHLLNLLDSSGLSIWWQDDGSLCAYRNKKTGQYSRWAKWCTHGFTYEENKIISKYLDVVWDVQTTVKQEKQKYFFQRLNATNMNKLSSIITVHDSMYYKVDMKYKSISF